MGVGKGSVAREVIKNSNYIAIDTDDLIESMENRRVKDIFDDEGEKYFRALEKEISSWLEKSVKNTLISTGGGFYKVKNLKKIGKIVFLDSPFEKIIKRIKSHPNSSKKLKKRPLLSDLKKAQELYDERRPEYLTLADVVIDVTDKSALECAKELLKKVK
ncbi:MAG: shikimate kinase [Sulfurimonas sp. CG08_land_8_20_14_0_20_36_33]|nr:MAG: shikimate kinase [Helicobacteraceae bacterium CG1_02_36_14]PIP09734.1 MAG: shikimate kinase [Sulfurimonas sp. CG23_combo_of_CG06-09_8_20_14_all_36_33]PIS26279.1 MAG: shikimate kinase [Sulfurimonas sp. CG08_land_8_20_14_0_20_36_33]PIU34362.1 MAG: shikimate kinase [Sulfurimonas sp. CG07_land_8_20_14_0_80_36_56]PIV02661.1 MAG: shikimate kinase [Sulfurimonas sp. CG03_land_8_20_14_0_80_36_25]PIV34757.1 MAG: shikimate kinase [Sulfurimonas sp. CG02_land_8_20_14_3_00_36_67]PIV61708.1 MAG: shi